MESLTESENAPPKPTRWCWLARWLRQTPTSAQQSAFASLAQTALDTSVLDTLAVGGHDAHYRAGLTLAELKPGECGTVRRLFGPTQGRLRLLEMGLTPGTHIRMVRAAAFGGPLDILVRGYQLSLRREEAAGVWLDDPEEDSDLAITLTPTVALECHPAGDL